MTVREAIKYAEEILVRHEIQDARVEAEWLLAHLLSVSRTELHVRGSSEISPDCLGRLYAFLKRRGNREPLQHLLGSVSFCGFEIKVGPQALIPRPETEQLAELAWKHVSLGGESPRVLDFGTGTGCLAVAVARHCTSATIHALDLSREALQLARENAVLNHVSDRISFHCGDGFAALPAGFQFDLVVSNPPYIPADEIAVLAPEVRDYDPHLALDGGVDGLDFYRLLAVEAPQWMRPEGVLVCEFGDGQETEIAALFESSRWKCERIVPDLADEPRFIVVRRKV